MRPEYKKEAIGKAVQGKYYEEYNESHNLVLQRNRGYEGISRGRGGNK